MIIIRTDANVEIATGHIMRCITIAEEIVRKGEKVVFAVSDEKSGELAEKMGYKVICLDVDWRKPDFEKESIVLKKYGDKLLIDTYYATTEYIKKMKTIFKIICFDDMFDIYCPADIIINYNIYYEKFDYNNRYGNGTKLLLGAKYVPLRKQFITTKVSDKIISDHKCISVMLICGGGDILNSMGKILSFMLKNDKRNFMNIRWNVIIGNYNEYKEKLIALAKEYENIIINENVKNMAEIMNNCDICISAASTVLYECCAMQLPTIFFCVADNQKHDAEYFEKNGLIYVGDFRKEEDKVCQEINNTIKRITSNSNMYKDIINKMKQITDGKGAERIAKSIIEL